MLRPARRTYRRYHRLIDPTHVVCSNLPPNNQPIQLDGPDRPFLPRNKDPAMIRKKPQCRVASQSRSSRSALGSTIASVLHSLIGRRHFLATTLVGTIGGAFLPVIPAHAETAPPAGAEMP